jgi:hypothetical protein
MNSFLKVVLAAAAIFTVSVCSAQTSVPAIEMVTSPQMSAQEFVFMKNGNLVLHKDGKETALPEMFNCSNGSIVNKDGSVIRKDGTKTKLTEGDRVYKTGIIVSGLDTPRRRTNH